MTTSLCSFMLLSGKGTYREGSNYLAIYNRVHRPTLRRESMPTTGLTSPAKVRLGRRRLVSTRQHVPTSRLPGHRCAQAGLRHVEQLAVVAWVERAARSPGPIAMKLSPGLRNVEQPLAMPVGDPFVGIHGKLRVGRAFRNLGPRHGVVDHDLDFLERFGQRRVDRGCKGVDPLRPAR